MDKLIELALESGSGVLLIAAGIFWGKQLIEYFFKETIEIKKTELNQGLEAHKLKLEAQSTKLKHDLNVEIEKQKSELELLRNQHQIKYSNLYAERATAIKELYRLIVEMQSAMLIFTRLMQLIIEDKDKEAKERVDRVNETLGNLQNYYAINRLFVPKDICEKIDLILKEYRDKGWDFAFYQNQFNEGGLTKEYYRDYSNKSHSISKAIKEDFPPLIQEIEDLFRDRLGDEK